LPVITGKPEGLHDVASKTTPTESTLAGLDFRSLIDAPWNSRLP